MKATKIHASTSVIAHDLYQGISRYTMMSFPIFIEQWFVREKLGGRTKAGSCFACHRQSQWSWSSFSSSACLTPLERPPSKLSSQRTIDNFDQSLFALRCWPSVLSYASFNWTGLAPTNNAELKNPAISEVLSSLSANPIYFFTSLWSCWLRHHLHHLCALSNRVNLDWRDKTSLIKDQYTEYIFPLSTGQAGTKRCVDNSSTL